MRPTPSPDGRTLALVRRVREQTRLELYDLETGARRELADWLSRDEQEGFAASGLYPRIDWTPDGENPEGSWAPAGTDWHGAVRTDVIDAITAAEVQGPDPDALATRWSEIVEIPVTQDGSGNPSLELQNATVRFVKPTDGRPEGLGGVDVRATDKARALSAAGARGLPVDGDTILISGTRFRLV